MNTDNTDKKILFSRGLSRIITDNAGYSEVVENIFKPRKTLKNTEDYFTAKAQGMQRFNMNRLSDFLARRGENLFVCFAYFVVKHFCVLCGSVANYTGGINEQ